MIAGEFAGDVVAEDAVVELGAHGTESETGSVRREMLGWGLRGGEGGGGGGGGGVAITMLE